MTAREKIDAAVADLKERNVGASTAAPPIWRLFWRLGLMIPPPHFLGFVPLTLVTSTFFALMMAAGLSIPILFAAVPRNEDTLLIFAGTIGLSASFFGVAMAAHYHWMARHMGLPSWSQFKPEGDEEDSDW